MEFDPLPAGDRERQEAITGLKIYFAREIAPTIIQQAEKYEKEIRAGKKHNKREQEEAVYYILARKILGGER